MGLFTKYCAVCGRKIEKGNDIVRFGKHFDSEEHAEQYVKETEDKWRKKSQLSRVVVAARSTQNQKSGGL